jgi:hypothetical protein
MIKEISKMIENSKIENPCLEKSINNKKKKE